MLRVIAVNIVLILCFCLPAQTLRGNVGSTDGSPVPFATIYIHETTNGIIADENGSFQVNLKAGSYTCEVRSIGFETKVLQIDVAESGTTIRIVLALKIQQLKTVDVHVSKENPALDVMRHAIARAPYHLYQVSAFTSDNYLKGSAKIESIPTLMKLMIKDPKVKSLIGKLFVLESQNQITFKSPSNYTQRVIAYKSSIPKEMEPKGGIRVSTASIYEAKFSGCISPLSPKAFQYYNFKLMDVFSSGDKQLVRVKVLPKLNSSELFKGEIFIVENDWSVFALDLSVTEMGTTSRYKIDYQEIQPTVFMPITYNMFTNIETMGVKGFGRFYSSVKYKTITLNPAVSMLQAQSNVDKSIPQVSNKQTLALAKIEKLSTKQKMSTIDAMKIARMMTTVVEPSELKEKRKSLEIKEQERVKMEIDSLASSRDTVFWENTRNVPLQADEIKSFQQVDSLPVSKSVKTTTNSINIQFGDSTKKNGWLLGQTVNLNKHMKLYYSGLLRGLLNEYNFVDGMWLGQKLSLSIDSSLYITPSAYYTTSRKSIVWDVTSVYKYAALKDGQLELNVGNYSEDIQGLAGSSRLLNSFSSLLAGDNVIRFMQNKYVKVENKIDILNGFVCTTGIAYENQKLLANTTDFHFWGTQPRPNSPDISFSNAFPTHSISSAWLKLEYTPFNKYRITNGRKEYLSSDYPTFGFEFKKALPIFNHTQQSSYDRIKLSLHQNLRLTEFDHLKYNFSFGSFISKSQLYVSDYNYFSTIALPITFKPFDNSFALLDNYSFSTSRWFETHISWVSDYMLIKRIGFIQRSGFNESLQLNALWNVTANKPYLEAGYSIGFSDIGRIAVFSGYDGFKYKNVGIKVSLPLFVILGAK